MRKSIVLVLIKWPLNPRMACLNGIGVKKRDKALLGWRSRQRQAKKLLLILAIKSPPPTSCDGDLISLSFHDRRDVLFSHYKQWLTGFVLLALY